MINRIIVEGNITADTALQDKGETKYCRFQIAVNEGYGDKKKTHFFSVVAFGKTAEFVSKYITKGDTISIDGRLSQSQYTDKEGNKKSSIGITAEQVFLLRKKQQQAGQDPNKVSFDDTLSMDGSPF
jgi:single-strand DNA-binding protein